jgi:hypothetical protein
VLRIACLALVIFAALGCEAPPYRPLCEPGIPCISASTEVCAKGPEARLHGRAALVDGTCGPRDEATCQRSEITCRIFGQCAMPTAPRAADCAAERDRDFLASRDPRCAKGTCIAARDEDCQAATVCDLEGRCAAKDGVCVARSPADCEASDLCRALGACSLVGDRCEAAPADCAATDICATFGECGHAKGTCVACERSDACRREGLCERVGTTCRATSDAHCRRAEACAQGQRCRAFQGACTR